MPQSATYGGLGRKVYHPPFGEKPYTRAHALLAGIALTPYLSFAWPTFIAKRSMAELIFAIKPSSLGVGVTAAITEQALIIAVM